MFVIEDVKIFTGHDFIDQGFVLIKGGRIATVGSGKFDCDTVDEEPTRISRPGDTLIPGLIDAHIHALLGNLESVEQSLRFGVTTVCDMHNNPSDNENVKKVRFHLRENTRGPTTTQPR